MEPTEPFALFDCSLARRATGKACTNLRELLDFITHGSDAALEHHMMHCALDDHFELYEFPNDLARWCRDGLADDVLAEQLGLIDPYQLPSVAALRTELTNVIEERLWGLERVTWCRAGLELYVIESRVIAFDTGERFPTPAALAEALPRLSLRSLFLHVHEAHLRTAGRTDDFSSWLERYGADPGLVAGLRKIDFYFRNIEQLRAEMIEVFRQGLTSPVATSAGR